MSNGNNNGHHGNGTGNGLVHVNGHKPDAAIVGEHELLWDGLSPAVTTALGQPLDPALVSQRKGRAGRTFDYLEGHTAIDQANAVFGYGGWGHEVVGDVALRELDHMDAKTGEIKRIRAYTATVRVTVPGAPSRTDVGFQAVAEENDDGHETAYKGAVTDGLKRALRTFGPQFGNSLYGDQPAANVPPKPQRRTAPAKGRSSGGTANRGDDTSVLTLRKRLVELGVEQGFDEAQVRAAVKKQTGKDLDELSTPALTPLVERAARKVQQAQAA